MTTTRQTLQRSALLAIGVLALTGSPALAQSYVFSDLGTLNGPDPISIPQRINNSGQIVGVIIPTGGENYVPVIWNGTNKTVLDSVPGGVGGIAQHINDAGHMAGFVDLGPAADAYVPALWQSNGAITPLQVIGGGTSAYSASAEAINNQDQLAGYMWTTDRIHAMRWDGTAVTDIGGLGGTNSQAWGINDVGQIVGNSNTLNDDADHAALWQGTSIVDLGTLGGTNSGALDINELGQIVGSSALLGDEITHATLWYANGGAPVDLGGLPGATYTFANAINNLGQIVGGGFLADDSSAATLWDHGQMIDLAQFLPADLVAAGWVFGPAEDINDHGVIIGYAYNTLDGRLIGTMLTPVPVPAAVYLFGSGLIGLAGLARRRMSHN